jgi:hypothetical protein
MEKYKKMILYCVLYFLIVGATSCSDYLSKTPNSSFNSEDNYKNFTNFQGFTEELYNCIPNFANQNNNNFFNFGEDEIWQLNATTQGALNWKIDIGDFLAWTNTGYGYSWFMPGDDNNGFATDNNARRKGLWPGCWYGIRKANLGLQNLSKMQGTEEEKNLIAGQLYFFRAWFHFELMTYWGGLPYISKVLPADQKLTLPRLTYQALADSIALDFKKAADILPGDWDKTVAGQTTLGKNLLRINKWMALAYLGKNYLYAGSPLMNMASGGKEEYNQEYCKKAAEALGTLLQASEQGAGTCQYQLVDFAHYSDLYMTNGQNGKMPGSTEAIFRSPVYSTGFSTHVEYLCAGSVLWDRSWSSYPCANYVSYFGMANGLPINDQNKADLADPTSGYDTNYPWKNRDPRFYVNFGIDTQLQVKNTSTAAAKLYQYANLYTGGNYTDPQKGSNTGYLLMKFNPLGVNKYDNAQNNIVISPAWLRLADVYLMYSEAIAMGYGDIYHTSQSFNQNALYTINKIRTRAGVLGVNDKYLGSVESFMSEVRRERAVELAYEGYRFNDLRRWHLLTKAPYTIKTGIKFDRAVPDPDPTKPVNNFVDKVHPENNKILNLKEYTVFQRNFSEKHYWLPFKQADINLYLGFGQNPGW